MKRRKWMSDGDPLHRVFLSIRRVFLFIFSMPFSLILGMVFAVSIAAATIIEARYGTDVARALVYNARWLEILLALAGVNLMVSIVKSRMWRKGKRMVFLFHAAFLLILLGAGVTRYFGREGVMHIREGGQSDKFIEDKTCLFVSLKSGDRSVEDEIALFSSAALKNRFDRSWNLNGHSVRLSLKDYISAAGRKFEPEPSGKPVLSLVVLEGERSHHLILFESESAERGQVRFSFDGDRADSSAQAFVKFRPDGESLICFSNSTVQSVEMGGKHWNTFKPNAAFVLVPQSVFTVGSVRFVLEQFIPHARIEAVRTAEPEKQDESDTTRQDALVLEASVSGQIRTVSVFGLPGEIGVQEKMNMDGIGIGLAYGSKAIRLPFGLKLEDFRIDRYPGSMKPSGFTSDVKVVDRERNLEKSHSIFMNHILRYRGYRFYQSSYDEDEMGTVLSVSRDPGMVPTYTGYILLFQGLIFGLFRPKSRFSILGQQIKKMAKGAFLSVSIFALFWSPGETHAADLKNSLGKLDGALCRRFAGLAVQDNGRIKPVHSLAKEMIRSENRLSALSGVDEDRLLLWAFAFPEEVGQTGYFQNNQPEKMLRLFPVVNDPSRRWITVDEAGKQMEGEDRTLVLRWADAYRKSVRMDDRKKADSLLAVLEGFQATRGRGVFPGMLCLKTEVLYNRADVFTRSAPFLFSAGMLILIISVLRIINPKWNWKPVNVLLAVSLILGFVLLTGGMVLRWFVSQHAPWTNKYESMVFIAWSVLLAGMLFGIRNRLMLAGAGILSSIFLSVAGMGWIDPKITTLPPVLRSIWLLIHVSVITSSYGFLGLGAVLALFNLLFMAFHLKKKTRSIRSVVAHETLALERVLLLGLMLLTIGNFLGAVWANESWGRYWGWDPKETWTLVTILVYALVLHLRFVPRLNGTALFNIVSLFAFGSVLMTYFGVNLYLSGMHSYASGERPGFPVLVIVVAGVLMLVSGIAWVREKNATDIIH